jgi:hypothetical protein
MRIRLAALAIWFLNCAAPALGSPHRLGGGGGGVEVSLTRIIMALVLGTMLAVLAALLIRRSGGRPDLKALRRVFTNLPSMRRIQVMESRRVSQHADLCLVRCDGTEYLILTSAQQQQIVRTTALPDALLEDGAA